MSPAGDRLIVVGEIAGPYGVRGWVRIRSFTEPRERILDYLPWRIGPGAEWQEVTLRASEQHTKALVAQLEGCDDRTAAGCLTGVEIAVPRARLPDPAPDEYYWADLEGLVVRTIQGVELGRISRLMRTGANDVMVVEGERQRLIPFVRGTVVTEIDLTNGWLEVDWEPEF